MGTAAAGERRRWGGEPHALDATVLPIVVLALEPGGEAARGGLLVRRRALWLGTAGTI